MGWMSSQRNRAARDGAGSYACPRLYGSHVRSVRRTKRPILHQCFFALLALVFQFDTHAVGIEYTYNSKGQLETATYDDGTVVTYQYDDNGNRTSATSNGGPDVKPPTIPTGVVATVRSSVRIDVNWVVSTDGGSSGLAGYKIERCKGAGCTNFAEVYSITRPPFQNSGLAPNTSYSFRIRAYDNAGNKSDPSAAVSGTTLPDTTPPTAPSGTLTATVQSSTQINLSWGGATDSGGSGLAGYRVQRCSGVGCTNFTQIKQQTARTLSDTGLIASTSYSYRVFAYDKSGNVSTSPSNTATATTSADTVAPATPTNLIASASSPTKVNLTWTASTDTGGAGLAGYKIERCTTASCTYSQIGTSTTNSYSDTTATPNTAYSYRVRAYDKANPANNSAFSAAASTTTPQDTTKPTAPTNLAASVQSSTSIKLTWTASTDSGGNLSGYNIERCLNAGCSNFAKIGTAAAVSGQTTVTYTDTNLSALKTYLYRVNAYDAAGNVSAAYSNTVSGTTTADTQSPSAPAVSVSATSSTQLTVTWTASTDSGGTGLAGYEIARCQDAGCASFAVLATVGAGTTTYPNSGLKASTTYVYRVRAYDAASPANYSSGGTAQAATQKDSIKPDAPTNFRAINIAAHQVDFAWSAPADQGGSGVSGYRIDRCSGSCSTYATVATVSNASGPGSSISGSDTNGVADTTAYGYLVRAVDADGNVSDPSAPISVTTPDATKPLPPTTYTFSSVTSSTAYVKWAGATDNVGVTGYRYQLNGGAWTDTSADTAALSGLACYTTYTVSVLARDAAGNWSSSPSSGSFRTLDGCAPGAPGTPYFTSVSYTSATASWGGASDNVGVTAYQYRINGGAWIDVGNSTTASLSGLAIQTQYTVEARAADAAGNWGAPSGAGSFRTLAPTIVIPANLGGSVALSGGATANFYLSSGGDIQVPVSTGGTQSAGSWLSPAVGGDQFRMVASNYGNCTTTVPANTSVPVSGRWSVSARNPGEFQTCAFDVTITNPVTGESKSSHVIISAYDTDRYY